MLTIPKDFGLFLEEIGVFTNRHRDEFNTCGAKNNEDKSIFKVADFFKSLTPSDCYDLSLRLYLFWKEAIEKEENQKELQEQQQQSINNEVHFHDTTSTSFRKYIDQTYDSKITQFQNDSHYNNFLASNSGMNYDTQGSNTSIFERLYSESYQKNHEKLKNEEIRSTNEVKDCTFQPNGKKKQRSVSRKKQDEIVERLMKDPKKEREELNAYIRQQKEVEGCTFHPKINASFYSTRDASASKGEFDYPANLTIDHTFDRLYKEHQYKKHIEMENEIIRQNKQVEGCTFEPESYTSQGGKKKVNKEDVEKKIKQLYSLHAEKQRNLTKKRLEKTEKEQEEHTFKPNILPSARSNHSRTNSKDAPTRLHEWEKNKKEKLEKKLKDREREESERRVSRSKKRLDDSTLSEDVPAYERLYKYSDKKRANIEGLDKKISKELGHSFTPKLNDKFNRRVESHLNNSGSISSFNPFSNNEWSTPKGGKKNPLSKRRQSNDQQQQHSFRSNSQKFQPGTLKQKNDENLRNSGNLNSTSSFQKSLTFGLRAANASYKRNMRIQDQENDSQHENIAKRSNADADEPYSIENESLVKSSGN